MAEKKANARATPVATLPPASCANCKHFVPVEAEFRELGHCRRFPPTHRPHITLTNYGPLLSHLLVRPDDVCGEHAR